LWQAEDQPLFRAFVKGGWRILAPRWRRSLLRGNAILTSAQYGLRNRAIAASLAEAPYSLATLISCLVMIFSESRGTVFRIMH
jgi:hypothetical protein